MMKQENLQGEVEGSVGYESPDVSIEVSMEVRRLLCGLK